MEIISELWCAFTHHTVACYGINVILSCTTNFYILHLIWQKYLTFYDFIFFLNKKLYFDACKVAKL